MQQDLVDEQREWESKKRANCRNAAAKGKSATESQYLQLQCDTRMTRERVQYLKGTASNNAARNRSLKLSGCLLVYSPFCLSSRRANPYLHSHTA